MEIKVKWKELVQKYMNTKLCSIIIIIGIVLMCLPNTSSQKSTEKQMPEILSGDSTGFVRDTEKRLKNILSGVSGVSDVSVMITVSDGGISIYEKNKENKNDGLKSELSLKPQGSGTSEPVLVRKNLPTVLGVIVTAKGADNPETNGKILSAVKAVLDVSAHRISVLPK